jgi:hypothetical protein
MKEIIVACIKSSECSLCHKTCPLYKKCWGKK